MTEATTIEGVTVLSDPGTPQLNLALSLVQAELPRIDKGRTATVPTKAGGQYSYSYADLADVSAAVLPLLGKHGLSFTAWPTLVGNRFVLRYELLHGSGESKAGEYPLPGDAGAQALGSAITYARRYCLCAVTGVSPDDDDDAAATYGAREAEQAEQRAVREAEAAEQQAELDREMQHAVDVVRGAWAQQYGEFDQEQAAESFRSWSKGGSLKHAPAGQLRSFAAYLNSLPAADAGSDPAAADQAPAAEGEVREVKADRQLGRKDNAHMFVLFEKLGMQNDRQAQLDYLRRTLERDLESRSEVRAGDWPKLRTALEADVKVVEQSGLAMTQPEQGEA